MNNTSLKQKLLLIFFSVFLTVIFLEIGLRLAGVFVLYLQDRHNHLSLNSHEYRILCLGESTTALGGEDSYPSQLEQMLNAKSRIKKFTVINKGIISTTSDYILKHIDQNLDTYQPQLVIVMMGINDKAYLHDMHKDLWWENLKLYLKDFRVYKLANLLYQHITHKIRESKSPSSVDNANDTSHSQMTENMLRLIIQEYVKQYSKHLALSVQYRQNQKLDLSQQEKVLAMQSLKQAGLFCLELAQRYRLQGFYPKAQKVLEQSASLIGNHAELYQEWGELYLAMGQREQALNAFQQALALDPDKSEILLGLAHALYNEHNDAAEMAYVGYLQKNPQDYWGEIELSQWLRKDKHFEQAEDLLNHAISIRPEFDQAYVELGQVFYDQGQFKKEEQLYLKKTYTYPSARIDHALGRLYQAQGNQYLSNEYFQKSAQHQMPEYCPATLINYNLLLDKILKRHIKVVVMQYPMRDIEPLKDYLGQKRGVIFVENSRNFKQALTEKGFNYYFKDNFAYDFGHCTRAGNRLIARNLSEVILKNE